jgi:ferredoxin
MSLERLRTIETHLRQYDAAAWQRAMDAIAPQIHEVDRDATRIWLSFFPLELCRAFETAEDETAFIRKYGLMGRWKLADQVDSSHRFLYAHRFWPQAKAAVTGLDAPFADLPALIERVGDAAGRVARVDRDRMLGIALVGLMTLRQAGAEAFAAAPGEVHISERASVRTTTQVLARRAKDNSQGPLGFLRGLKKQWTVTFDENDPEATFTVINDQEMATGAQGDKREYRSKDSRCIPGEGPIPVECRAASCGTCWVGVLAGREKLSPVAPNDEGKRMKVFGYVNTTDPKPLIRLACQARAFGAVSVVIPPWNGMIGKLRNIDDF